MPGWVSSGLMPRPSCAAKSSGANGLAKKTSTMKKNASTLIRTAVVYGSEGANRAGAK